MTKAHLKEIIKSRIRHLIQEALPPAAPMPPAAPPAPTSQAPMTLKDMERKTKFIQKIPPLKRALVTLLSTAYDQYVTDITLEAPRPATFRITMVNGLDFNLIYSGGKDNPKFDNVNGTFIAQIVGKRYDLTSVNQSQQAMQKISQQLLLSPAQAGPSGEEAPGGDPGAAMFGGGGGGGDFPGGGMGDLGAPPSPGNIDDTGATGLDNEGGDAPNTVGNAEVPQSLSVPSVPEPGEDDVDTED